MATSLIWAAALFIYLIFWFWYVGMRPKVTPSEIAATISLLEQSDDYSEDQINAVRAFLEHDDGKDFVMVNLLKLKEPKTQSKQKLDTYSKIFLANLLKRAGHPIFMARAASGNIEDINSEQQNQWTAAAMVRYRSRRDFMEIIPITVGSEHHNLKLESLSQTFAFAATPWTIVGGPRFIVPLLIALLAMLSQQLFT